MHKRSPIIVSATAFSLAALLFSLPFFLYMRAKDMYIMIPASAISAFATGALFWWLLFYIRRRITVLKGLVVGLLVGLLSHYLCWYIYFLSIYITGMKSTFFEQSPNPIAALFYSALASFLSIVYGGWVTGPIGAVFGAVLARKTVKE